MNRKRFLSGALCLLLTLSLLSGLVPGASALDQTAAGPFFITGQTDWAIAPGVTETQFYVNDATGLAQSSCHLFEVDLTDPTISVRMGYRNFDGSVWGMQNPSLQALRAEEKLRRTQSEATVVGLVNASFYNMTNGAPIGAFVMDGQIYNQPTAGRPYLVILDDGTAEIRDASVPLDEHVKEAVAGRELLVRGGVPQAPDDGTVNPRTAVGVRSDGTLLIFECDGRQKPVSQGLTLPELAQTMAGLGCVDAINLDGGGSACFMARRPDVGFLEVQSSPSDGYQRSVSSTLLLVSTDPDGAAPIAAPDHTHDWLIDEARENLRCDCGETRPVGDYSGFVRTDGGAQMYLIGGTVQTDWIACADRYYHAGSDGILHDVTCRNTKTCLKNGYIYGVCNTCGQKKAGNSTFRSGHVWDRNHVCTVCGAVGKDIQTLAGQVSNLGAAYAYDGTPKRPTPVITDGDRTLVIKNSYKGDDGFINWSDDTNIGTASITIEGRGDYFGTLELTYDIVPGEAKNPTLTRQGSGAILRWSAVRGAAQYAIFSYDAKTKQSVEIACVDNTKTEYTIPEVKVGSTLTLCVKGRTPADGKNYDSARYSWVSLETYPGKVKNVKVTDAGADCLTLAWDAQADAEQYAVFAIDSRSKVLTELGCTQGNQTELTVTGLRPETTYTLCVKARVAGEDKVYDSVDYTAVRGTTVADTPDDPAGTLGQMKAIRAHLPGIDPLEAQRAGSRYYLFLPAFADPGALTLSFDFEGEGELVLSGPKGEKTVGAAPGELDLNTLADPDAEGVWALTLRQGDLAPMRLCVMRSSVPAMFITSAEPEEHGRAFIDESKDNSSAGTVKVLDQKGAARYDGPFTKLKARGNTTFTYADKKSYQIKLDKKADLIGIGEKLKTWVLLAGYVDATQLHDKTLKDLAKDLGMPYTPLNDWVDLYYDGEYRGTYLLGEKNAINTTGVNITDMEELYEGLNEGYGAENAPLATGRNAYGNTFRYTKDLTEPDNLTGGYLLELNHNFYEEASGFLTTRKVGMNVKSPEWAGREAMTYISEYYQDFEDAVYAEDHTGRNPVTGKYYYEYVDLESLVRVYLLEQLSGNVDGFVSSFYFYKEKDQIMYAGPVWDLDNTCGTGWSGYVPPTLEFHNARYLATALSKIPGFMQAVQACYKDSFRELAVGLQEKIDRSADLIRPSVNMNYKLWPLIRVSNPEHNEHIWQGATYDLAVNHMKWWLDQRMAKLDETVSQNGIEPTHKVLPFGDVKESDYFFDPVYWAYTNNITAGKTATAFAPAEGCTRAQVVTFLWRAAGSPKPAGGASPFEDVKAGSYYSDAVIWAVENGITQGTSEKTFSPDRTCTRAQVVTFLYRFEGCPELTKGRTRTDVTLPAGYEDLIRRHPAAEAAGQEARRGADQPVRAGDTAFTDVPETAYYHDAVIWAVENGITQGVGGGRFAPNSTCTRAQIVTFLYRDLVGWASGD